MSEGKTLPEVPRPPRRQNVLLIKLRFPFEYGLFLAFNLLDLFFTMLVIARGWNEVNPIANWFILWGGKTALIGYKIVLTLVVIALCEGIATKRPLAARLLIWFGIVALGIVVATSGLRFYQHLTTGM